MFGKAKCKRCGDEVRFALRRLKQEHSEVLHEDVAKHSTTPVLHDKDIGKLSTSSVLSQYIGFV